jgi:SPOR domain
MAESNHRSYRDLAAGLKRETSSRAPADDPLAELARLIGQSVPMQSPPMNESARDSRPATPAPRRWPRDDEAAQASSAAADAVREGLPDQASDQDEFEPPYNPRNDGRYEPSHHANPSYHSRSSRYDDTSPPTTTADDLRDAPGDDIETGAHADGADVEASYGHDSRYGVHENEAHDLSDDHAYGEEYDEYPNTRRRGGFIFVAAIFGLAVLGTAGAFAYLTMFGGPMLPSLPPIIRAEGGPNKIVPSGTTSQGGVSRQADANSAGSGERLVSREEQPVDVPAPVSARPRAVSTVPIFPDPAPAPPPGGSAVFPPGPAPLIQPAPGARVDSPPAASAPPANAPSATSAAASAAMPAWPTPPLTTAAVPAPKKIRTVSIRADQPSSAEPAANPPASQAAPMRPGIQQQGAKPAAGNDTNGPLSIVPSSGDTASAPVAAPRTAAAHPVPLNKSVANETASAAPVASSGGYAVQLSSQGSEAEAQSSFRALQAKYPNLLGGREPIVRRADLGEKGIYYRAMVGPFASREQATDLCSNLKAAGGSCIVQKN